MRLASLRFARRRDGYCSTGSEDRGVHTICAVVTKEFLNFSRQAGNDLITPHPEYNFPGLKEGGEFHSVSARLVTEECEAPCEIY